jgi:hypothetical protein
MMQSQTTFDIYLMALSIAGTHEGVLGKEYVVYPPSEDYGYGATPRNAMVFGKMGVDGVHYAILKIDGQVREHSPVIQIDPMEWDYPYSLLAPTFKEYLAVGCGVKSAKIDALLSQEEAGEPVLLEYLRSRFRHSRFRGKGTDREISPYLHLIIVKDAPS